jgi:hypothetical protein
MSGLDFIKNKLLLERVIYFLTKNICTSSGLSLSSDAILQLIATAYAPSLMLLFQQVSKAMYCTLYTVLE